MRTGISFSCVVYCQSEDTPSWGTINTGDPSTSICGQLACMKAHIPVREEFLPVCALDYRSVLSWLAGLRHLSSGSRA